MASKQGAAGETVPPKTKTPSSGPKAGALDALANTVPVMVQMNPEGKWQSKEPNSINDRKLQEIVQHLLNSNAISGDNSCCSQCAAENLKCGKEGGDKLPGPNYVPIIMMPIHSTDNSPFDFDCEPEGFQQVKKQFGPALGLKAPIPNATEKRNGLDSDDEPHKKVKQAFALQRFTDFDLMSQW